MAIVRQYPTGTVVVIEAKATISSGDATQISYQWRRDGVAVGSVFTGATTATLAATLAGVYDVVVSHPNAEDITSEAFTLTYRDPIDYLRISYNNGTSLNSDYTFANATTLDWNIAEKYYEFGPDQNNGFESGKSGWWRVWALEKDVSLDITLRGSSGGTNGSNKSISECGEGGVGTLRRNFEQGQIYTFRPGDRRTVGSDDVSWNAPNGGRIVNGGGSNGGGCTYMKRGGTLLAVCGGGGGSSDGSGQKGGDGGGPNVNGEGGSGGVQPGNVVQPGSQIHWGGYPLDYSVRIMTSCGTNPTETGLSCSVEQTANDVQNNGGFGVNGGGAGGSGVQGGKGGQSNSEAGGGGSGWSSGAVDVLQKYQGGNPAPKNGSVLILKTGFIRYLTEVTHTTGVRRGLSPSLQVLNLGSYNAEIIPQNVGYNESDYDGIKHYLVKFPVAFPNTNYTLNFTYISRLQASLNVQWDITVQKVEKSTNQFRVWFQRPDGGQRHVNKWHFDAY